MKNNFLFLHSIMVLSLLSCSTNTGRKVDMAWNIYLDGVGTFSSIRVVDLNQDGILDIVMGAGGRENHSSDTAVIALNGADGQLLWKVAGLNQFIGSAVFQDINQDGIPDVFIGGRWAELLAINGADGTVIWRFLPDRPAADPSELGWYNFTTPQWIPDQDGDGLEDLLISNGGDQFAPPDDPERPAGKILIISSKNGKVLAEVQVPDGKETYMSVVSERNDVNGNHSILFGTGGETIGGCLFRTTIQDVMNGDISNAKVLVRGKQKGFIAPPVLVDINSDGIKDIVINAVEGRMLALDGRNDTIIWEVDFPGMESYSSPAVGYFNGDSIPDFFTNYGIGTYPDLPESLLFMVDGGSGNVTYQVNVQGFQYASPVVVDLYGDGFDVAIMNKGEMKGKENNETILYSYLLVFDFIKDRQFVIGEKVAGYNLASTPWIGDLDGDGFLDIIYSAVNYIEEFGLNEETPSGLSVIKFTPGYRITGPIVWGAYMGSDYSGIFPNNEKHSISNIK